MAILTVALAGVQILMGVVMFLWSRVLNGSQESVTQLREALQVVVQDHSMATRELRGALEAINTRLLADTLPRQEFERYRAEIRDDMRSIYESINQVSASMNRLEMFVTSPNIRAPAENKGINKGN